MSSTNQNPKKPGHLRTVIGAVIAVLLAVFLLNPEWLPVSAETKQALSELEKTHFLIERSGHITLAHILAVIAAICVLWICYRVLKLILDAAGRKSTHARTISALVAGAARYLVVIIGIVWSLNILGVNSTAVLAGIGILGLILGFGAQSLVEDVITGLFIIFEEKYSIGDIIILDDFRGTVRDIGVRTTTIEDAGKNLKVVNNSDIRNFQNRSRNTSIAACEVSVSYETDLRALEEILNEKLPDMYAAHSDLYLASPRYLGVTQLADSGVNIKIIVETKEENVFAAQRMLTKEVRILFAENGVEIPFPQVVVHPGK